MITEIGKISGNLLNSLVQGKLVNEEKQHFICEEAKFNE